MKIIIAGAGEVGTHLAKMLSQENQDIILMDPNEERLNFSLSNVEILPIVGNPTSPKDLEEAGIRLYGGVSGSADAAVQALLAGTLAYDPNAHCDHHGHEGHDHSCGEHSCGGHSCGQ